MGDHATTRDMGATAKAMHISQEGEHTLLAISFASSVANSMQPTLLDSSDTPPSNPLVASAQTHPEFPAIPHITPSPAIPTAPVKPALSTIKDKPSDLGIKPIKDKDSWIIMKKVIDTCLHRGPYWSGPSKNLITTSENATASGWWEEVLAFFCALFHSHNTRQDKFVLKFVAREGRSVIPIQNRYLVPSCAPCLKICNLCTKPLFC
jgi:hypothetical protein